MQTDHTPISCYLLTYNSERYLRQILEALRPVADEILIVDSGSTDATATIAADYGANFIHRHIDNFRAQRQFALDQCRYTWVLNLDSDEVPTEEFVTSLVALKGKLQDADVADAYRMERRWIMFGQEVHTFYPISSPDFPVRLFRKDKVGFTQSSNFVHENPAGYDTVEVIKGAVYHYSCDSVHELYRKLNQYTSLAAQDMYRKGKKATRLKLIFSPVAAWIKWYLRKGGWRDGEVGKLLGRYAYDYTYQKYLKLRYDLQPELYTNNPKEIKRAGEPEKV